jgi:uncharacterized protein YdhG (YjbR/CyaY superfamily)
MKMNAKSVAECYSLAPEPQRSTLLELRARILEYFPQATEIIKYGMPTFVVNGKAVAGIMNHKNHVSYYPYSGSVLPNFPEITRKYKTSKGTVQMPIDKPLLKSEIRKLLRASAIQNK